MLRGSLLLFRLTIELPLPSVVLGQLEEDDGVDILFADEELARKLMDQIELLVIF